MFIALQDDILCYSYSEFLCYCTYCYLYLTSVFCYLNIFFNRCCYLCPFPQLPSEDASDDSEGAAEEDEDGEEDDGEDEGDGDNDDGEEEESVENETLV